MLPGMIPGGAVLNDFGPALSIEYTASDFDGTDGTSFSFASVSVGASANNRHIVVAVHYEWNGSGTPITVDIAGNSATEIADVTKLSCGVGLFWVPLDTVDTTATIDVTLTDTSTGCGISVWRVYGDKVPALYALDTDEQNFDSDPATGTVTAPDGSVVIAAATCANEATLYDFASGVTRDNRVFLGGSADPTGINGHASAPSASVTVETTDESGAHCLAVASFR